MVQFLCNKDKWVLRKYISKCWWMPVQLIHCGSSSVATKLTGWKCKQMVVVEHQFLLRYLVSVGQGSDWSHPHPSGLVREGGYGARCGGQWLAGRVAGASCISDIKRIIKSWACIMAPSLLVWRPTDNDWSLLATPTALRTAPFTPRSIRRWWHRI